MEKIENLLKKYRRRLVIEAVIKSVLLGLTLGFIANLTFSFVDWMFGLKLLYVGIAIGAGVAVVSAVLFYALKFKPTEKQVAQRLDALGLLERVITMNELKNDNSYLARRQREDATAAIDKVSTTMLKVAVSASLVIMVAVSMVFSAGFTVAAQTAEKSGTQLIDEMINGEKQSYCTANYDTDGEGYIEGDIFQEVEYGKDATPVTAVAEDGWMFVGWSDGLTEPTRQELKMTEDVDVFAIFMEAEESEESGDDDGDGNGDGEEGDGETGEPGDGESGNGTGEGQNGDGAPGDPREGESEGQDQGEGAGSGRSLSSNQIIDGDTYYGDCYGDAVTDAAGRGNNGSGSGIVNDYINGLGGN